MSVKFYNFIASWQLFPEKGTYEFGNRPKSGIYKITVEEDEISIDINWVTLENHAFTSNYKLNFDGELHPFISDISDSIKGVFIDSLTFKVFFSKDGITTMEVLNELLPNGYLRVTQITPSATNIEIYHKQLSVLPYSTSVSGAVIKPTEEGVIRHKALTAMEEQTNMQLDQIRKQVELLAIQAQEIQMRKELSLIIYNAKLNFSPVIGNTYYLYESQDGSHFVSMISPKEWGRGPFKTVVASVKLLSDHTWVEI